ncbi:Na+/H+ antiporter NhaA [Massilia sp. TS11]|uniref:Na+/H+ antiporter NhaA n=1 Tax=Massilia sp. TS11 TaxID=2908003 RepID=UPI001EDA5598|nr:Na+/H+ antiporter NhaA [Massilia sp. TS11]MCG2584364.1 Na+/H+ antiporter NhaA [Massilia sp. TS11]
MLTNSFVRFFESERAGGVVLIFCTALSLVLANSAVAPTYLGLWHARIAGMALEQWINDGLMAVFFLLVGLELERELYVGELSKVRQAMLPIVAALGGMLVPAAFHFALNHGSPTQGGAGIPMATDIAFAMGALAMLGSRIPPALKVFLAALAVMDDLGAIIVIAVFYAHGVQAIWLSFALALFMVLISLNRLGRVIALWPYLLGGVAMWYCMLQSGVHATIAGVLLAFAIPFSSRAEDEASPSHRLEHILHKPVAFFVLPIFALANTGITLADDWQSGLLTPNSLGILAGLVLGKPIGIALASFLAVAAGFCALPSGVSWRHVLGAGMLGGIGFTMSIFIANLAFAAAPDVINASKLMILAASLAAGIIGWLWLNRIRPLVADS